MKKLSITKEAFEKSKYFTNKYGKLEYVSESGNLFKTIKGKILKFKDYFADKPKVMLRGSENGETQTGYLSNYDRRNGIFTIEVVSSGKKGLQFKKGDKVDVLGALLDEFKGEIIEAISDESDVD